MRINSFTGDSLFSRFILRNADDGGAGGTDGDTAGTQDDTTDTTTSAKTDEVDIQKLIAEAVDKAVAGLKKKNEEVIGDNKKLKTELSSVKGKPSLSEEEYTEYKTFKERIERDEMLKLMTEGKSEEVIARVTQRTRLDLEAKIAAETEARTAKTAEAAEWRNKYEQTLVSVEVAKATAASVKPQYQDLVMKLASERVKMVDGAVRIVNDSGEIEMNTAGTKPLTVHDYVESLRSTYNDLFVVSTGGGASGSGKKSGSSGSSTRIAMDHASELSMEEYVALRASGKIA